MAAIAGSDNPPGRMLPWDLHHSDLPDTIDEKFLDDSQEVFGDAIERVVTWKAGSDVSQLKGTPVRLRFVMKDADLDSFRFAAHD
jgi:hypothetical protein